MTHFFFILNLTSEYIQNQFVIKTVRHFLFPDCKIFNFKYEYNKNRVISLLTNYALQLIYCRSIKCLDFTFIVAVKHRVSDCLVYSIRSTGIHFNLRVSYNDFLYFEIYFCADAHCGSH
jgi:hypothetical protein